MLTTSIKRFLFYVKANCIIASLKTKLKEISKSKANNKWSIEMLSLNTHTFNYFIQHWKKNHNLKKSSHVHLICNNILSHS